MAFEPISLEEIEQRLWSRRDRICRDFGITVHPASPHALADALVCALAQSPRDDVRDREPSPAEVFEAAVRALGSNHRRWVAFLANEGQIRTLLANYQPELASKELSSSCDSLDKLTALLPGRTSEGDAKADLCLGRTAGSDARLRQATSTACPRLPINARSPKNMHLYFRLDCESLPARSERPID